MIQKPEACPSLPWKARIQISMASAFMYLVRGPNGSINRRLTNLLQPKSPPSTTPLNGVVSSDHTINPQKNLWLRIYTSTSTSTSTVPVIIYFHGGGFNMGSAETRTYDNLCRTLSRELSAVVVSVNYRLAPEYKVPSQYEDGMEALKFIDTIGDVSFTSIANRKRCFVAGDSAGGNLAHHVAVRAGDCEFHELKVIGVVAIQPFFGGEERVESEIRLVGAPLLNIELTDWMWKGFLPEGSDRDHPAVNVTGPNSDLKWLLNYPDPILFVGGLDPLQDWQMKYYQALKRSGKQVILKAYPNAIHGFYSFPYLAHISMLIKDIHDFLQIHSSNK